MKILNLLPQARKKELELEFLSHKVLMFWTMVILSLIIFVILAAVFRFYMQSLITSNEEIISVNKQRLEAPEYKQLHDEILALNDTVADIKNINNHHYAWSNALYQLSSLVSARVQLNQLSFSAAKAQMDISGQARERQDVLVLYEDIKASEFFDEINFPLNNLEQPTSSNFTFTFNVDKTKFLKN